MRSGQHSRSIALLKVIILMFDWNESKRGFLSERKGKAIPFRGGPKTEKVPESTVEKSCTRNLGAESIGGRAESTVGCVKLRIVTDIRRRSARDTFITQSVYFLLNIFSTLPRVT